MCIRDRAINALFAGFVTSNVSPESAATHWPASKVSLFFNRAACLSAKVIVLAFNWLRASIRFNCRNGY